MPFASIAVTLAPVDSTRVSPGNDAVESTAATLIALSPDAGEPSMYGFVPLLPADATTMMPASTALFDASASAVSFVPHGEPSDMFTTSMSCGPAQASAL